MKICCELPNCMLNNNLELNDYDFILYHLYKENEQYREYYNKIHIKYPNRITIFDNSAYEFYIKGQTLNIEEFIECINKFKPTYFIIPDKLGDCNYSCKYAKAFKDIKTNSIGIPVIQGSCEEELIKCLKYYNKLGYNYIAIPFHLDLYKNIEFDYNIKEVFLNTYKQCNDDILYAVGRVAFVNKYKNLLDKFEKVHFLGSHCPLEKIFYKDFYSIDTSYPVKLGIKNIELFEEQSKPDIILDDFIDIKFDNNIKYIIKNNIKKFKNL